MTNNQYTYNQPPMGQMMPPPQMGTPHLSGWRARMIQRYGMWDNPSSKRGYGLPSWMLSGSVFAFIAAFIICSVAFGYVMPMEYAIFSVVSVLLFFYGTKQLAAVKYGMAC